MRNSNRKGEPVRVGDTCKEGPDRAMNEKQKICIYRTGRDTSAGVMAHLLDETGFLSLEREPSDGEVDQHH